MSSTQVKMVGSSKAPQDNPHLIPFRDIVPATPDDAELDSLVARVIGDMRSRPIEIQTGFLGIATTTTTKADLDYLIRSFKPIYVGVLAKELHYINKVVFPVFVTDDLEFCSELLQWIPTLPTLTPAFGTSREIEKVSRKFKTKQHRTGLSFTLEGDFSRMQEGIIDFYARLSHIAGCMSMNLAFTAMNILYNTDTRRYSVELDRSMSRSQYEHRLLERRDNFVLAHKSPKGLMQLMDAGKQRIFRRTRQLPTATFFPYEHKALVLMNDVYFSPVHGEKIDQIAIGTLSSKGAGGTLDMDILHQSTLVEAPALPDSNENYDANTSDRRTGEYRYVEQSDDMDHDKDFAIDLFSAHGDDMRRLKFKDMIDGVPFIKHLRPAHAQHAGGVYVMGLILRLFYPSDEEFSKTLMRGLFSLNNRNFLSFDPAEFPGVSFMNDLVGPFMVDVCRFLNGQTDKNRLGWGAFKDGLHNVPDNLTNRIVVNRAAADFTYNVAPDGAITLGIPNNISETASCAIAHSPPPIQPQAYYFVDFAALYHHLDSNMNEFMYKNFYAEAGDVALPPLFDQHAYLKAFGFMFLRVMVTSRTRSIVQVVGGENTGITAISEPNIVKGEDPQSQYTNVSVTQWQGVHLHNPDNVNVIEDVFLAGVYSGANTNIIDWDRAKMCIGSDFLLEDEAAPSVHVIPVKRGEFREGSVLHVPGRSPYDRDIDPLQYPHAPFWNRLYGFSLCANNAFDDQLRSRNIAAICYRMRFDYMSKTGQRVTNLGNTHFGIFSEQPGTNRARNSGVDMFPQALLFK